MTQAFNSITLNNLSDTTINILLEVPSDIYDADLNDTRELIRADFFIYSANDDYIYDDSTSTSSLNLIYDQLTPSTSYYISATSEYGFRAANGSFIHVNRLNIEFNRYDFTTLPSQTPPTSFSTTTSLSLNLSSVPYSSDVTATINVSADMFSSPTSAPSGSVNLYYQVQGGSNILIAGPTEVQYNPNVGGYTSSATITFNPEVANIYPSETPYNLLAEFVPFSSDFLASTSTWVELIPLTVTNLDTTLTITSSHPTGALTTDTVNITVEVDATGSNLHPTGTVTLTYNGITTEAVAIQGPPLNAINSAVFQLTNLTAENAKTINANYTPSSGSVFNSSSGSITQDVSAPAPSPGPGPTGPSYTDNYFGDIMTVRNLVFDFNNLSFDYEFNLTQNSLLLWQDMDPKFIYINIFVDYATENINQYNITDLSGTVTLNNLNLSNTEIYKMSVDFPLDSSYPFNFFTGLDNNPNGYGNLQLNTQAPGPTGPIYTVDLVTVSNLSVTTSGISFDYSISNNYPDHLNMPLMIAYQFRLFNQTTEEGVDIKDGNNLEGIPFSGNGTIDGSVNYIFNETYTDSLGNVHGPFNVLGEQLFNLLFYRSISQTGDENDEGYFSIVENLQIPSPANSTPTDISLDQTIILENNSVGDVIGTFSTTDADSGDTFTYSLVGGTGGSDNGSFIIDGAQLKANAVFVHATKSSYAIRVRSTDQNNASFEEAFTIQVQEDIKINVTNITARTADLNITFPQNYFSAPITQWEWGCYETISGSEIITATNTGGEEQSIPLAITEQLGSLSPNTQYDINLTTVYGADNIQKTFNFTTPSELIEVSNNQIPQVILDQISGTSFTFQDPLAPALVQSVKIFSAIEPMDLALGTLTDPGVQINIKNAPTDRKFIFADVDSSWNSTLSLNAGENAFIFKVVNLSGVIQQNVNINTDIYLDVSGGSVINLTVNGQSAGQGTYQGMEGGKHKYSVNITRGDGFVVSSTTTPSPSAGSDPHITTIFGKKYDFHPSTRRNYTLFQSKDMKVSSHFTGLKSGVYYDKVMIDLPNKQQVKVDFHSKQIKGKSSFVSVKEESIPLKYENHTSDKSVGKMFEPKKMTKLSVAGKNPVDLFVDFQTRYVHFRFPETLPVPSEMSGLIVAPATRLD